MLRGGLSGGHPLCFLVSYGGLPLFRRHFRLTILMFLLSLLSLGINSLNMLKYGLKTRTHCSEIVRSRQDRVYLDETFNFWSGRFCRTAERPIRPHVSGQAGFFG